MSATTASEDTTITVNLNGYLTWPASRLSLLSFLSASKCKNIKNIPCIHTFADTHLTIRALTKLIFGGDRGQYLGDGKYEEFEPAVLEIGMKEADLSSKNLGVGGAIIVGAWISHKDNGALESISFGDEQVVTMKTNMTEADFSGKQLGPSGAIIVAAFLPKCQ